MPPRGPLPLDWLGPTLDRCRDIIERGGGEIREKPSEHDEHQVVTDVDLAVERTLVSAIRDRIPFAAIFSEEGEHDPRVLDESEACFVIDPIDGTDELIAGRPGFAISVAQYGRGIPVAAVLDFPRLDLRFEGAAGQGVWRGDQRVRLKAAAKVGDVSIAVSASQ